MCRHRWIYLHAWYLKWCKRERQWLVKESFFSFSSTCPLSYKMCSFIEWKKKSKRNFFYSSCCLDRISYSKCIQTYSSALTFFSLFLPLTLLVLLFVSIHIFSLEYICHSLSVCLVVLLLLQRETKLTIVVTTHIRM